MNWKNINRNDVPQYTDLLLRIEEEDGGGVTYLVGFVTDLGDICTKGKLWQLGGTHLCNIKSLPSIGIKSIHYVDPREILL